ncbi:ABC transporter permease subunit [Rhodococcus sp. H29-C3]|uniref:ABC transporter permease subunit n=1 Tax=Rhodococcus sp. H29-C3 TaxID=3046307 RepID=UPI0024BBCF36|nr:ABC transporter permease subunit [Rhodococcus sp. H29-C3]MDJ0361943.1 ABC transporter permease subunit [Rhodococcus sp. H29-C3]
MSTDIFTRELTDRRMPVAALGVVLALFAFFVTGISSGLEDVMTDLTDAMPDAVTAFIPAGPGGYAIGELFNLIAPLALIAYAVITAAAATAGEEKVGTMALLSAQPVTRRSILAQKAFGVGAALAAVTIVFGAATVLSAMLFGVDELTPRHIAAACLHLYLLALLFGAITLAAGAVAGDPGIATGVGGGLAVAAWVSNSMLPIAHLDAWARISPWYYYVSSEPLSHGVDLPHILLLVVLTLAAATIAAFAFDRRDLKG